MFWELIVRCIRRRRVVRYIGAGDPQDGPGGNIGAIGNGEPADQFGLFGVGTGTPSAPVIASFTASPSTSSRDSASR